MEPPLDGSVAQPTGCGASVPETGMSMADDNTLRRYRSNDPYRRAAEPPPPSEEASARDPLAELARLLGQNQQYEQSQHYDDEQNQQYEQNQHYEDGGTDGGQSDAQEAEYAYQDDVPLEPHEHEVYDDAPRARRGGFATALALIGCAVLG